MSLTRGNPRHSIRVGILILCLTVTAILVTELRHVEGGSVTVPAAHAAGTTSPAARHVIIISIDGLRPDALHQAETVNIKSLWQGGSYSWKARTVFPSVTLPSHASMLSGLPILKHGVNWNDYEPDRGYIKVPTVLSIAHHAGHFSAGIVAKIKLKHLAPPESVDYFGYPGSEAMIVGRAAAECFTVHDPAVLFIHFAEPDKVGHSAGWMSPEQLESIKDVDRAMVPLMTVLRESGRMDETLIIISADHGGHERTHGSNRAEDMTIPWIASGAMVKSDYEISTAITTYDTAATALYALGLPIPESFDGRPVTEIFNSQQTGECPPASADSLSARVSPVL